MCACREVTSGSRSCTADTTILLSHQKMISNQRLTLLIFTVLLNRVQGTRSGETEPLILPLLAVEYAYATRVFVTYGDTDRHPSSHLAYLYSQCGNDDYVWESGERTDKVLWNGIGFSTTSGNRPNSVTFIESQALDSSVRAEYQELFFCWKSPSIRGTHFERLMSGFTDKTIAFWSDLSVRDDLHHRFQSIVTHPTLPGETNPNTNLIVGEMTVGGVNRRRFVQGSTVSIRLKSLHPQDPNDMPHGWESLEPVSIKIGRINIQQQYIVKFNIDYHNSEAIVTPMIFELLFQDIPSLDQYQIFNCEDASYINSLDIGPWHIEPHMMYRKSSEGYCFLVFQEGVLPGPLSIMVDVFLLRHFHFAVTFDAERGDFVRLSTRLETQDEKQSKTAQSNPNAQSQNIEKMKRPKQTYQQPPVINSLPKQNPVAVVG